MNRQVLELIEETVWAILEADPAFQAFQAASKEAVARLKSSFELDEQSADSLFLLEDAFLEGGRHMARVLLPMALELGLHPASIFDLPEHNGADVLVEVE